MKISLRRRHALTVADGAFSHKIDYILIFKEILNPEGHPNCITGSKVKTIFLNGGFCPLVELHREGSAPAACAAGLFISTFLENCWKSICMYCCSPILRRKSLRVSNIGDKSVPYFYEEKGLFPMDWRTTMHANGFLTIF